MFHQHLSGLSQEVGLTTVVKSRKIDCRTGSLLWTHFGISGPVVMDASRFWTLGHEQGKPSRSMETSYPVRRKNRRSRG